MDCTALSSTSSLARSFFSGGRDDSGADRLCEYEEVARLGARVGDLPSRLDQPGNGEPVLGLVVVDRVAADYEHARFSGLVGAALQHLAQYVCGQAGREGDYVQAEQRPGAGGVNVAERICGGYRAEGVRVVDDGWEEVHRLDQCDLVRQPVDGGVIAAVVADQQIGVVLYG